VTGTLVPLDPDLEMLMLAAEIPATKRLEMEVRLDMGGN